MDYNNFEPRKKYGSSFSVEDTVMKRGESAQKKKKKRKYPNYVSFRQANMQYETRYKNSGNSVRYLVHTPTENEKYYHTLQRSRSTDEYRCSNHRKTGCEVKANVKNHSLVWIRGTHKRSCGSFVPIKTSFQKPKKKEPRIVIPQRQMYNTSDSQLVLSTAINSSISNFPQQAPQNTNNDIFQSDVLPLDLFSKATPIQDVESDYNNFLEIENLIGIGDYNPNLSFEPQIVQIQDNKSNTNVKSSGEVQKGFSSETFHTGVKRTRFEKNDEELEGCAIKVNSVEPCEICCGFGTEIAIYITFISKRSLSIMSLIPPNQIKNRVFVLFGKIPANFVYNISPSGERNSIIITAFTKKIKDSGYYDVTVCIPPALDGVKRNGLRVKNEGKKDDDGSFKKSDKGSGIGDGNNSDSYSPKSEQYGSFFEVLLEKWFGIDSLNQKKFDFSKINPKRRLEVFRMYENRKDYMGYDIGMHFIGKNLVGPLSKLLESKLCDIDHLDNFGNSYFHWAHYFGNEKVIKLLKKHEAIENEKNYFGMFPHEFTKKRVAELIKENTLEAEKHKKVTKLNLRNKIISKIEGLEKFTSLKELDLFNNQITKIEGLEKLKSLNTLNIDSNQITKIEGLEKLTLMKTLNLSYNQITKIEGLEKLKSLTELDLSLIQITKIEGLEKLKSLKILYLSRNRITKIEGLENLTLLNTLHLDSNQITKIKGLEKLTSLKELDLSDNQINKIEGLERLSKLKKLDLNKNQINIIEGMENLTKCKIDLLHNPIVKNYQNEIALKRIFDNKNDVKCIIDFLKRTIIDLIFSVEEENNSNGNGIVLLKGIHTLNLRHNFRLKIYEKLREMEEERIKLKQMVFEIKQIMNAFIEERSFIRVMKRLMKFDEERIEIKYVDFETKGMEEIIEIKLMEFETKRMMRKIEELIEEIIEMKQMMKEFEIREMMNRSKEGRLKSKQILIEKKKLLRKVFKKNRINIKEEVQSLGLRDNQSKKNFGLEKVTSLNELGLDNNQIAKTEESQKATIMNKVGNFLTQIWNIFTK